MWRFPLAPHSRVVGDTPTSSSSSSSSLQSSNFQLLPWLWPPPLSWSSESYTLHDGPLLHLENKGGTIASPHTIAVFHGAAP